MATSIKFERVYNHPVEKLWKALSSAEAMSQWIMPTNFKPEIGYEFQFTTKPYPGFDGITKCKVLEIVENEKLVFSWSGGSLTDTIVSFQLIEKGEKTLLKFEHSGFEGVVNNMIVKRILSNGWKKKILAIQLLHYLKS